MTALAAITLGLCVLGLVGSVLVGTRQGAAATGLAVVFGFGVLRQAFLLYDGSVPAWGPGAQAAGELACLGIALGGILALRSLRRTTHERDRAEDLHWDSMEAVRVMSELAARPGADLSDKLGTVLELGAARFELEIGVAWRGDGADGEVIGLRAPESDPARRAALIETLLPRLREASRATRPQIWTSLEGEPRVLFGAAVGVAGDVHGALAFAGSRDPAHRFTATDKDVLGLMAQWLAVELERKARGAQPAAAEPAAVVSNRALRPLGPRPGRDLNTAVRRAERPLRRRLGADATLEVSLDPALPPAGGGRLSLSTLVESVVLAAARLAPTGRIRVETRQLADPDPDPDPDAVRGSERSYATLCVSVTGEAVDADALQRVFEESADRDELPRPALPLGRIERLLRRDGGDLSVSVEPGQRAALTAYLKPVAAPAERVDGPEKTAQPSV